MVHFAWCIYRRTFRQPLQTHHGVWRERQGIVIRLEDENGRVGFGEIAPLPWFGSETLEDAETLCRGLGDRLSPPTLAAIPSTHPACQFGLAIAWETLCHPLELVPSSLPCALLPTGLAAFTAWQPYWESDYRTFKWKIGVAPVVEEIATLRNLLAELPQEASLRLDANGGLSLEEAEQWLDACADYPQIEFLEQPLSAHQVEAMQKLGDRFPTPIALDESVATLADLKRYYHQGWRGVFVVKAAIAGFPQDLQTFCQKHRPAVVLSSVFETAIAHQYLTHRLLPNLPYPQRVPGLGTQRWFPNDGFHSSDPATLWHRLSSNTP
ncbi:MULTISPECIES: o-succinylbenzoate synthase [unclassified Leptolyngbya]|uniref:o-succinylbenzoate synthase n=1 Tax=unclassified Leptolyngbya TaxID=2650499 RepID=UPI00168203AE|nr:MULTISPECIES: o-succinylbenzoate synthase [unclassified Leptolyngbya]MBD1909498.1 o-succinylbenzoate synthase [Leptolyngbya sp. FACHB-8]MBD2159017.1 o-succinylbenzoate synthase [Leptolyngbya sp. FACHB-16]